MIQVHIFWQTLIKCFHTWDHVLGRSTDITSHTYSQASILCQEKAVKSLGRFKGQKLDFPTGKKPFPPDLSKRVYLYFRIRILWVSYSLTITYINICSKMLTQTTINKNFIGISVCLNRSVTAIFFSFWQLYCGIVDIQ